MRLIQNTAICCVLVSYLANLKISENQMIVPIFIKKFFLIFMNDKHII